MIMSIDFDDIAKALDCQLIERQKKTDSLWKESRPVFQLK
jgi:hypothetical protein